MPNIMCEAVLKHTLNHIGCIITEDVHLNVHEGAVWEVVVISSHAWVG